MAIFTVKVISAWIQRVVTAGSGFVSHAAPIPLGCWFFKDGLDETAWEVFSCTITGHLMLVAPETRSKCSSRSTSSRSDPVEERVQVVRQADASLGLMGVSTITTPAAVRMAPTVTPSYSVSIRISVAISFMRILSPAPVYVLRSQYNIVTLAGFPDAIGVKIAPLWIRAPGCSAGS